MMQYEAGAERGFVAVPMAVLTDAALSWKAKAVWAYIAGARETAMADIKRASTDSQAVTRAAIKELRDRGYAEVSKVDGVSRIKLCVPQVTQLGLVELDRLAPARSVSGEEIELRQRFDELWRAYPPRSGAAQRPAAWSAYKKQRKAGALHVDLMSAVAAYKRWCVAEKRAGTQYVMSPARFLNDEWRQWLEQSKSPTYKTTAGGMKLL